MELAPLTEAGLDLATFQDHPYQRRFLDAWALVATVLARDDHPADDHQRQHLPLRPPHVLATTVASLDVLQPGRVELGIGAGAFWDAIVQAGGPRRTPGEAWRAPRRPSRRSAGPGGEGPEPARPGRSGSAPPGRGCSS